MASSSRILKALIVVTIALIPLGQLLQIYIPGLPAVNLDVHDVVIGIIVALWIFTKVRSRSWHNSAPLAKPLLLFNSIALLSLVVNAYRYDAVEIIVSSLYLVRFICYSLLYMVVYETEVHFRKQLIPYLSLAGIAAAVFGLFQYFWYPDLRYLIYLGWDPHEYRLFGTFFDTGFMGIILVLALISMTHLILSAVRPKFSRVWILGWLLTYSALLLTYSRSSFIAFAIGLSILLKWHNKTRILIGVLILLTGSVLLLPRPSPTSEGVKLERTSTIDARFENYSESWTVIRQHPIVGVGFNTIRYAKHDNGFITESEYGASHAGAGLDNSLLFVWATTGIIGLATYLFLLARAGSLGIVQRAALVAIIVHSMFNNTLFYTWVMLWMWILLAVADRQSVPRNVPSRTRRDDL